MTSQIAPVALALCNLVMDNAPIHKPEKITEEVNKRGYRIVYLPLYSPFLNPIEELWTKVKNTCSQISNDKSRQLSSKNKRGCRESDS